jgi:hypothetical protein
MEGDTLRGMGQWVKFGFSSGEVGKKRFEICFQRAVRKAFAGVEKQKRLKTELL